MATIKQKEAARRNIKHAQEKWKDMSSRQRSLAQPEGRNRVKPGAVGEGDYFRVIVRDKDQFTSFRTHDVGRKGGVQRLAGHRKSGSWDTQAWLISKEDAHIENDKLVPDTEDAKGILEQLGSEPKHLKADIFQARPRRNVPESKKPTQNQIRARTENIKKAQEARWGGK